MTWKVSNCCFAQGSCDGQGQASFEAAGRSTPSVSFLVRGWETQPTTKGLHIHEIWIPYEMTIRVFSDLQKLDTDKNCQLLQEIVALFSGLL